MPNSNHMYQYHRLKSKNLPQRSQNLESHKNTLPKQYKIRGESDTLLWIRKQDEVDAAAPSSKCISSFLKPNKIQSSERWHSTLLLYLLVDERFERRPFTPLLAVVLFVPSNHLPSQNSRKEAASKKVKGVCVIWIQLFGSTIENT